MAKVLGPVDPDVAASINRWRRDRNYKSVEVETSSGDEPLPVGTYLVSAAFVKRNGEKETLKMGRESLHEGESVEDLKKKGRDAVAGTGFHNFGMDTDKGKYPDGHPVQFALTHDSGRSVKFVQRYDSQGFLVE